MVTLSALTSRFWNRSADYLDSKSWTSMKMCADRFSQARKIYLIIKKDSRIHP